MKKKQKLPLAASALTVATVHTARGIAEAGRLRTDAVSAVEVRLDCLTRRLDLVRGILSRLRLPVILTARHPAEGGAGALTLAARRALLEEFLPHAAAIDIEIRSARGMQRLLEEAGHREIVAIFSFHDFRRTPSLARLRRIVADARRAGAGVVKIATQLRGARDLAVLLQLQALEGTSPLATMGMGPLGRVSRLALAAAGSRLNYGYLDRPQVAGQWPAARLSALIHEIRS